MGRFLDTKLQKYVPECEQDSILTYNYILKEVAAAFDVTKQEIASPKKTRVFVRPRQAVMCFSYRYTPLGFSKIGFYLNRDHTSVMYACQKVSDLIEEGHEIMVDLNNRFHRECDLLTRMEHERRVQWEKDNPRINYLPDNLQWLERSKK